MDILMAIDAFDSDLPETPSITLFMTGETGCCQVCTSQFKRTFIVLFNGKTGSFKSQD